MNTGVYTDVEDVKQAEAAYWDEHGYRFGGWQFLPETGEVRRNGWRVCQLSSGHADILKQLIDAHPSYIAFNDNDKVAVHRIRRAIGRDSIVAVRTWGYRFNPEAVM